VTRDLLSKIVITGLISCLLGCAGSNIPDAKPTTGRDPQVAEVPGGKETVRGDEDPPIITLDLGSGLHERRLAEGDDLPANIVIPTTNLNAVPITAALQAILEGTDVSLSWDTGKLGDRLVTVVNLSGPLPKVIDKVCSAAKVFCSYRNGSLELADKETFIVNLPPVAKATGGASIASSSSSSSTGGSSSSPGPVASSSSGPAGNSMIDTITQLTGGRAQIDDQGGNIIYTTDVEGESRVRQYLEQLRNGRPLIVLQLYIWEVTLNKENSEGINWNELKLGRVGPGFEKTDFSVLSNLTALATSTAPNPGAVSLGAVTTGKINSAALAGFLSTQGRLQTISNPQVTFVSGSSAALKVGGTQRYISQIGQLVSATNISGTSNPSTTTGVGTNTVNTDSISTGLTVAVAGSYENGVVFANFDLAIRNLVGLNPTSSGGGTIDLPETTDEQMSTIIRVRPGDNLVMAGLVTSADTNSRQGIPLGDDARLPMYGDDQFQNHELVIVVKPSVVLFSDKGPALEAKKKEDAKPPLDAVLIDKDGAKTLTLPRSAGAAVVPQPAPKPELMVSDPNAEPLQNVAVAPSADGAPVDRRLMQRGFSHAFDELLQPSPTPASAENSEVKP
jgi:hypothetical protein